MVTARLQVSSFEPAGIPDAIELFDREFIFSRGRSISIAQRFSDVFGSSDCFITAGTVAEQLVSALLVRPFTWAMDNRIWRGAMIGLVCTTQLYRGNGYAAELFAAAEQRCRELRHDFAVLCAGNHGIYKRLGWVAADRGMLGTLRASSRSTLPRLSDPSLATIRRVHALHETRRGQRVKRQLANYKHLLPPEEQHLFFLEGNSFALGGEHERSGYVYGLAVSNADMPRLWDRLSRSVSNLYINVERDSVEHCWLREHTLLEWNEQSLTMWKPLRRDPVPFHQWYIPFMDRI
jgi:GNAT superfamily N-acetyltransferase